MQKKTNNNTSATASGKCNCGRRATIGEEKGGINMFNYKCPDCKHYEHKHNQLTKEQFYKSFNL